MDFNSNVFYDSEQFSGANSSHNLRLIERLIKSVKLFSVL